MKTTGIYLCIGAIVAKDLGRFAWSKLGSTSRLEQKIDYMSHKMDFMDQKLSLIKENIEKRLENLGG